DNFEDYVEKMRRDSKFLFALDYEAIKEQAPTIHQISCDAARLAGNIEKNRYKNVLPFDFSRVKLLPIDEDDECSDYINASYLPGVSSKTEYIAAQGPKKSTLSDFWRMIWEQNVSIIVMIMHCSTSCSTEWFGDKSSLRYFGESPYMHLNVNIRSLKTMRYLMGSQCNSGGTHREIQQFQFLSFPDHDTVEETSHFLDFVKTVRNCVRPTMSGPMVVHCSAGVGRTGTFIAVDRLLQQIQTEQEIDIYGTVSEMRERRVLMVQTESQYILIHDCILDALKNNRASIWDEDEFEDERQENIYVNGWCYM
ncbi:hypothetical protein CAPTEDRAFT_115604, partial [Capitella teleta]